MDRFLASSLALTRPIRTSLLALTLVLLSLCLASPALAARVSLEWDGVSDSDVAGYRIYYGTSSRDYTERIEVTDTSRTQATVSDLQMGRTYYFAAVSYNSNQESDYTQEVTHTPTDSDGDGLSDYDENHFYSTDPEAADTDGDGIDDGAEVDYWKSRADSTWDGDIDGDGRINLLDADSDGDGLDDGAELDEGSDPANDGDGLQTNPHLASDIVAVNHQWSAYELAEGFTDPVIVAGPVSENEADPSVVRIRNATSGGFEIRLQEFPYLDGTHAVEAVNYLALESGIYELDSGALLEAGRFTTEASGETFQTLTFRAPFEEPPVVLTTVESFNGGEAVAGRIRNIGPSGFDYRLQEQEDSDQVVASQSVAYVAWTPSSGTLEGTDYDIGRTGERITDSRQELDIPSGSSLLADLQTHNDPDPATLRWESGNATQTTLRIQEERSADNETSHSAEAAGYMAFGGSPAGTQTLVFGDTPDADKSGTLTDTFININEETNEAGTRLNTYTWPENSPANAVLLKADLSALPEGATIRSATLELYQTAAGGDTRYDVSAHRVINHDPDLASSTGYTYDGSGSWTANDVAYNGIPLAQEDIAAAESVRSLDQNQGYKGWDVTQMVRTWMEKPEANFGLLLNSDVNATSNSHRFFASSEVSDASRRPRLVVEYTTQTTETKVLGHSANADVSASLRDSFININEETNEAGTRLNTYTWPENSPANAGLIKCDLSWLPSGAAIENATLRLYQTTAGGDARYDVSAHRVINHDPILANSTGYTYDGSGSWTANDVAYNGIPLAQEDIAAAESVRSLDQSQGYKEWDITQMVRTWAKDPEANFGLLLNSDDNATSNSHRFFASSEVSDASIRPEIVLTYSSSTSSSGSSDSDGDGLSDSEEVGTYGTDPDLADTDGDGLDDGQEVLELGTDPLSADTDGDGLSDGEEVRKTGTDPTNPDTDDDGLRDGAEIDTHSTDPLDADTDGDGLSDGNEVQSRDTDPTLADTDGDGVNDGDEVARGSDPNAQEITSPVIARGEIAVDGEWKRVSHGHSFSEAVVVAGPLSQDSDSPAVTRIRNATASEFEIRLNDYGGNETQARETVGYLVLEKGRFRLNNATNIETGSFEAGAVYPEATAVSFRSPLAEAPVVVTSVVTDNESQAVNGRVWNVTREGFSYALQEAEASSDGHATETVHYVAWEPSTDSLGDTKYEAAGTGYTVSDSPAQLSFVNSYERAPVLLGGMQTSDGTDPATLRLASKNSTSATVFLDEEQSEDNETSHVTESVGYLTLSSQARETVFGDAVDAEHTGTLSDTFININRETNAAGPRLNTYTWPENTPANAVLLKADLSALPEGATIRSATLELYQTAAGGDASYDVSAHRVINHDPVLASSTGYTYDGSGSWTANDVAYNGIPLAQEDIAAAESVHSLDQSQGYKGWDVTQMVRTWMEKPETNFGVLLNSDDNATSNSYRFFASGEAQDAGKRPKLKVIYTR